MEKAILITTSKYTCKKRYSAKDADCKGIIDIYFNVSGEPDVLLKHIEKTLETIKKEVTADFKPNKNEKN